jgi:hypothetical protein
MAQAWPAGFPLQEADAALDKPKKGGRGIFRLQAVKLGCTGLMDQASR